MWWALLSCDDTILHTGGAGGELPAAEAPTFYQDVLPLLETHCNACHAPGQIGPFPLQTYEQAAPFASAIANAVISGSMPPWPPGADCNRYLGERRLEQDAIDTLAAWADGGAPEGDASQPVRGSPSAVGLSRVDLEVPIPEPYTPPADPNDDYRCFLLPLQSPQDVYVTGFGAVPGDPAIVHHVIAYLARPELLPTYEALDAAEPGPGWPCFGGPGGDDVQTDAPWLGGWVPGSLGDDYPAGTGILVPAGSSAVVQIHYNTDFVEPGPDQTSLQVSVAPTVQRPASLLKWYDPRWVQEHDMPIPAGAPDVVHTFEAPNPVGLDGLVWAVGLHQHLLGTKSRIAAIDAAGAETCLLDIPEWDFHWQGNYFLQEPVPVGADDKLRIECHFDNSAGTQEVNWGEGSADEMCLGLVYATLE
jgi:hypothetical protein